jgi:hypothetical protein
LCKFLIIVTVSNLFESLCSYPPNYTSLWENTHVCNKKAEYKWLRGIMGSFNEKSINNLTRERKRNHRVTGPNT